MEREMEIRVGDKRIALNHFAKRIITDTLVGMLGSLKHVEPEKEITIRIAAAKE